jgi:hypothetical protein
MDFIALAQSSHAIIRLLTESNENSGGGSNEDDDFADLENISHDHDRLVEPSSSSSSSSSSSYGAPYTEYANNDNLSTSSQFINTSRPLLSPTAEQELLSLSTNFLLYTAMVVIVTLVAQIYFPSCLEPREPIITTTTTATARGRRSGGVGDTLRMDSVREEGGFGFEDDDEDEEEEDDDDVEGRRSGASGRRLVSVVEEEDDNDDEVAGLLLNRSSTSTTPSSPLGPSRAGSTLFMREEANNTSFLNELMDENKKKSRESVYTNLAICAIMLNLTFVSWGLLQVNGLFLFNILVFRIE